MLRRRTYLCYARADFWRMISLPLKFWVFAHLIETHYHYGFRYLRRWVLRSMLLGGWKRLRRRTFLRYGGGGFQFWHTINLPVGRMLI